MHISMHLLVSIYSSTVYFNNRIVDENLIVEVKCPHTNMDKPVNAVTVPFLKTINANGDLALDMHHRYYYQVQGQLLCSDRLFCDFVVYTLQDMKIIRIKRNEQFISDMVVKLKDFYEVYFKPALLENCFYKNTDKSVFDA